MHRALRLLLTAIFLSCFHAQAQTAAADPNTVHDRTLRMTVTKPAGWHFLTGREKRTWRYAVTLENGALDAYLKNYAPVPRIVITKYPADHPGLNPSVTLGLYDLGIERLSDSLRVAQLERDWLQRSVFESIQTQSEPQWTQLDGKPFATAQVTLKVNVKKQSPFEMRQQKWFYSRPLAVIRIVATSAQTGEDLSQAEIDAIIASIRIDR